MSDNNVWACRLPKAMTNAEKEDLRKLVSRDNPSAFHSASTFPITKEVEDTLEQMSLVATKEAYGNDFWQPGTFFCSRCHRPLYSSGAKFSGQFTAHVLFVCTLFGVPWSFVVFVLVVSFSLVFLFVSVQSIVCQQFSALLSKAEQLLTSATNYRPMHLALISRTHQ